MKRVSRDVEDFCRLILPPHTARLREMLLARTLHDSAEYRGQVIVLTVALCYRDREMFQPPEESWVRWIDDHMEEAVARLEDGPAGISAAEAAVWSHLLSDTEAPKHLWTTSPGRYDRAVAAEEGTAEPSFARFWYGAPKDCKPCWKCRWFDGWLPPKEPVVVQYLDPAITEACANLDRHRIEIARKVREGLL